MSELETKKETWHPSILVPEILGFAGGARFILDGTLGDGGHTLALAQAEPGAVIVATELDPEMLERARRRLAQAGHSVRMVVAEQIPSLREPGIHVLAGSYADLNQSNLFDFILLDLGVSTYHLREADRGFSFFDSRLDMRFRPDGRTAAEILNQARLAELEAVLLSSYNAPAARRLARKLFDHRPYQKATDVSRLFQSGSRKHHPATLIFQALRMAVNGETASIERALQQMPLALRPGGRLAILAFHSGEDRLVKFAFKEMNRQAAYRLLTPRAIQAGRAEQIKNRQSRSARLRVIERVADI